MHIRFVISAILTCKLIIQVRSNSLSILSECSAPLGERFVHSGKTRPCTHVQIPASLGL